jgi:hypothetical protein
MSVLLLAIAGGPALAAPPPEPKTVPVLKSKVDLDGNGKADAVQVLATESAPKAVKVLVGKVALADTQMYADVAVRLVDVDSASPGQHVLVEGTTGDGDKFFTFFAWDGKRVVQALKYGAGAGGAVTVSGDGLVVIDHPHGFWTEHDAWHGVGLTLDPIKQPFLSVGTPATAKQDAVLRATPMGGDAVVTITSGTKVDVLLMSNEDVKAYLLRSPGGLVGWIDADSFPTAFDTGSGSP